MSKPVLAIHGGAGTVDKNLMTPELEAEYRSGLDAALKAGWSVLEQDGRSIDAVQAAVVALENFPLFNAGRGSVFTHDGRQEMDASIMDGSDLRAGAVAAIKNIRNPITLARAVMERTAHILLVGEGAMQFAAEEGFPLEPDEYFFTEGRWRQLQDAIAAGRIQLDHASPKPLGTVGAVACDAQGRLAAATSTGGMTNKKFGRIGDTPLIGAGTYANERCAVSCTGHGEYFMLGATAYDVAARMAYKGLSLKDAAGESVAFLTKIGGEGGVIAADNLGNVATPFNSEGMYRGVADASGFRVSIYRD
ncbi:MAG: isoaspartyl peptidase/L-asparaginase [Acidobacteria bacterium]|nr:isoaspartyl peptidase/L-asparaginase [Acidobacteriota bacterium]